MTIFPALETLLAIVIFAVRRRENSSIHNLIDLFSVFLTNREYNAPDFENQDFHFAEIGDASPTRIAEIANHPQAIIDRGNENLLSIRGDRDVVSLVPDNKNRFAYRLKEYDERN